MRAVPVSITYRMPGTVRDVSATFVAITIRRVVCGWNTRCCSAAESRAYSGITSTASAACAEALAAPGLTYLGPRWLARASVASRISRSPEQNTRMSPGPAAISSSAARQIPVGWSSSSSSPPGPPRPRAPVSSRRALREAPGPLEEAAPSSSSASGTSGRYRTSTG